MCEFEGCNFIFSSTSRRAWSIDDAVGKPHGNSKISGSNCIIFSASSTKKCIITLNKEYGTLKF